jgi:hypothetical protein
MNNKYNSFSIFTNVLLVFNNSTFQKNFLNCKNENNNILIIYHLQILQLETYINPSPLRWICNPSVFLFKSKIIFQSIKSKLLTFALFFQLPKHFPFLDNL